MFKKFKKLPTSKKLVYYLFANCTLIEFFTLLVTFISVLQVKDTLTQADFSPLLALIGAFVTEVIGYAVYCLKSVKENQKGGIVYELALKEDEVEEDTEEEIMG